MATAAALEPGRPRSSPTPLDLLVRNAARAPRRTAMLRRFYTRWEPVTLADLLDQVRRTGKGLAAAGVRPGDRVALWGAPCPERIIARYAVWSAGAVAVEIGEHWPIELVERVLSETGAAAVLVEHGRAAALDGPMHRLPGVGHRWALDQDGLDALAELGEIVDDDDLDARAGDGSAIAVIAFTAGTTAEPRGCVLTHGALRYQAQQLVERLPDALCPGERALVAAPAGHIVSLVAPLACVYAGAPFAVADGEHGGSVGPPSLQPTVVIGVPSMVGHLVPEHAASWWALMAAVPRRFHRESRTSGPRQVLLGGDGFVPAVGERLSRAGIEVHQGYCLTEAGGFVAITEPGRSGALALRGTSIRAGAGGVIEVSTPSMFAGYWNDPALTTSVLCPDGWLRTSDVGSLDESERLRLLGKQVELIPAGGSRMSHPAAIERHVERHPLVDRCWLTSRSDGTLLAVVTVDRGHYEEWLQRRGRPTPGDPVTDPDVRDSLRALVAELNRSLPKALLIGGVTVVAGTWTVADGELAPTGELRRHVLQERYRGRVRQRPSPRVEIRLPDAQGPARHQVGAGPSAPAR